MAPSVSLSTRVSPDVRMRLVAVARERRVPLSTLARDLLVAGVDGNASPGGGGGLANEIECAFSEMPGSGIYREVCLALARTVESGGGGQVAAAKELLATVDAAIRLFLPEDDEDEFTSAAR